MSPRLCVCSNKFLQNLLQELFGTFVLGIAEEVGWRVDFDNFPAVHKDNAVGHFTRKAHFMGDDEHGHA